MPPLPYPHRIAFLAPTLTLPDDGAGLSYAKILGALLADHLVRHPVVSVLDYDDQVLSDSGDRLHDLRHPDIEATIDSLFRLARREEVLWFELSLREPAPAAPAVPTVNGPPTRAPWPNGSAAAWRRG
jgi:hypothetical protein